MWINPRANRSTVFMPGGSETVARQSNELGGAGGNHFQFSAHVRGADDGDQLAYDDAGTGGNSMRGGDGVNGDSVNGGGGNSGNFMSGGGDGGNASKSTKSTDHSPSLGLIL